MLGRPLRSGLDEWARRLYEDHVDAVHGYLARRAGRQLANDLTADVFRIAIEQRDGYVAARGSHRGWLFGIATNLVRHHWRSEARRLHALTRRAGYEGTFTDPLTRVDERLDAHSDVARLITAVMNLQPHERDLLVLSAWEGCSAAEIADALDIPTGAVRTRLHRLRRTLRIGMEHQDTSKGTDR